LKWETSQILRIVIPSFHQGEKALDQKLRWFQKDLTFGHHLNHPLVMGTDSPHGRIAVYGNFSEALKK
jgi:hypothetical protein